MNESRKSAIDTIRANILQHGRHLYSIFGGEAPRYIYTIGMLYRVGYELVLPGQSILPVQEAAGIVDRFCELLMQDKNSKPVVSTEKWGKFSLKTAHDSWSNRLLLGALDFYSLPSVVAMQVVAEPRLRTIDVPNMRRIYNPRREPIWGWLDRKWPHPAPGHCLVAANLDVLRGAAVTDVVRWEDDYWEMFSKPASAVSKDDVHLVPLAMLIGSDPTLEPAAHLEVKTGLYRWNLLDGEYSEWEAWSVRNL